MPPPGIMESVGSYLREARLGAGRTIEQVSAKTRISVKNLQAIEDDNLSRISSPFFYKSFVRQFADCLGLDYTLLAPAVQSAAKTMPQPLMPGEGGLSIPKVPALTVRRPRNLRWIYSVASFAVMLVACSTLYAVWENSRSHWRASLVSFVTSLKPSSTAPPAANSRTQVKSVRPGRRFIEPAPQADSSAANSDSVSPPGTDTAFRVELSALERTWLSIMDDGQQTFSGVLQPAETKVLEAHDTARVRTGNAGGISCVFNGRPIGTLGPRGQVRTVVFTKDNYEVLEASPHIALTLFTPSVE